VSRPEAIKRSQGMDWRGKRQSPQCKGTGGVQNRIAARWRRAGRRQFFYCFSFWRIDAAQAKVGPHRCWCWAYWSFLAQPYWYRRCFRSVMVARKTASRSAQEIHPARARAGRICQALCLADTEDYLERLSLRPRGSATRRPRRLVLFSQTGGHRHAATCQLPQ